MSFRLVRNSVTLSDLERRNSDEVFLILHLLISVPLCIIQY